MKRRRRPNRILYRKPGECKRRFMSIPVAIVDRAMRGAEGAVPCVAEILNQGQLKLQTPNTKHQKNPKFQAPKRGPRFELGTWSLELLWCLELGVWGLGFRSRGTPLRGDLRKLMVCAFVWVLLPLAGLGGDAKPVSYYHEIVPILKRSCTGCHHPGKLKGELDLTTYALFQKGGKHGPAFKPGHADESRVIEEVSGEE